jgi:rubrerythrin
MNPKTHQLLLAEVRTAGEAYIRNLAAAETAIYQGQFNVAKVLRAVGHAQRVMALNAARLVQPKVDATQIFTETLAVLNREGTVEWHGTEAVVDSTELQRFRERTEIVRDRVWSILQRSIESLANHPDVLERDVDIFIWGCFDCGNLVEGERPAVCDLCGAPAIEFQFFGPYYNDTPEHLGRLFPEEIIAVLTETPANLTVLVADVDNSVLERRPTPDEWSAKEIIAHIIETDRLFLHLSSTILSSSDPVPTVTLPMAPWKTHEGKGYERLPVGELLTKFRIIRNLVLDVFNNFSADDWSRSSSRPGRITSMLDWGRWLANHDPGHLAQIRRLVGREETG